MSVPSLSLVLSRKANADIRSIIRFTSRLWGTDESKTYVDELRTRLSVLIQFPYMGSPRPEYGKGRRGYIIDSYLVLYTVTETDVRVARIVHTKRDIDRALGE